MDEGKESTYKLDINVEEFLRTIDIPTPSIKNLKVDITRTPRLVKRVIEYIPSNKIPLQKDGKEHILR